MSGLRQFTEEESGRFFESGIWKTFSAEQLVTLQLFQKRLCIPFGVFHEAMEKVLGRSIWTHEFAFDYLTLEYLKIKKAPSFDEIISLIPEEKRVLIFVDKEGKEA